MEEYETSVDFVNSNVDTAAEYVEEFGIFKAAVAKKAIPYCNITFIKSNEMKTRINQYLTILYESNPYIHQSQVYFYLQEISYNHSL